MLKRQIFEQIKAFILSNTPNKNVLIVQGARQVGKSFLVNSVLDSISDLPTLRFNLEEDLVFKKQIDECIEFSQFERLLKLNGFVETTPQVIFIDEAQESESIGGFVRFMKEKWENKTVILSGSSMSRVFRNSRVPVGRIEYLLVTPLSFREFLIANRKDILIQSASELQKQQGPLHSLGLRIYDEYMSVGGLPAVVSAYLEKNDEGSHIRKNILYSQEEDFNRKNADLKGKLFHLALKAISTNLGYSFSNTRISENARDNHSVLNQLINWHIAIRVNQESFSSNSNLHPKIYIYDIGLAKELREIQLPKLSLIETLNSALRTSLGGLIENSILLELYQGSGFLNEVTGWKSNARGGSEVDFVYELNNKTKVPIEVKASQKFRPQSLNPVFNYLNLTGQKVGFIVSAGEFNVFKRDDLKVFNIPCYQFSKELITELLNSPL